MEGEVKKLGVEYMVKAQYSSAGTSAFMSDWFTDCGFYYDLTPAGYWGDGIIGQFSMTVDYQDCLRANWFESNIPGFVFDKTVGVYVYNEEDFDVNELGAIWLSYDYPFEADYIGMYHISNDSIERISSSVDDVELKLLFDNNLTTGAIINPDEFYIEMVYEELNNVKNGFVNGCLYDEELYYDYSRIKTIRIGALDKETGRVHYDESEDYTFKDRPFDSYGVNDYYNSTDLYYGTSIEYPLGNAVYITIVDTYPGRKYDEVFLCEIPSFHTSTGSMYVIEGGVSDYWGNVVLFDEGYDIEAESIFQGKVVMRHKREVVVVIDGNEITMIEGSCLVPYYGSVIGISIGMGAG